jgi:exopolyphosphatase/guanosine-5'-triphosphate,3'-diphosphate pyrophosphatase
VLRLAAILRLAVGLDRSHTRNVQSISLRCHEGLAMMQLATARDATVDIWGAMRKVPLFENVFDLKVRFSCASHHNATPTSTVLRSESVAPDINGTALLQAARHKS